MNQQQTPFKIILVGDSCYDETHYGQVNRLSPEAPIPILDYIETNTNNGMTYNVYENFLKLGFTPDNILLDTKMYEVKTRYVDIKTKQQLLRVDQKIEQDNIKTDLLKKSLRGYDAIVISDYDKGHVTYDLVKKLRKNYNGPIFIDSKKPDLKQFEGCFIKINDKEYQNRISWASNMIVTYGGDMVTYKDRLYTPPKVEAFDACGCGDTFLAALVYNYLVTNDMSDAILFAMKAAAITVKHFGVYAPTLEEIKNENYYSQ